MTGFTPPPHIPYQWHNAPIKDTPLDAVHLEIAENDLVGYTQQAMVAYDTYAEGQFVHQDGTGLPGTIGIRPEAYGAGYNGSAIDDWGPAITQAWADAYTLGTWVQFSGKTYGIRTAPQYPTMPTYATLPPLIGIPGGATVLKKLADVTLLNVASPNAIGSGYYQGSLIRGITFDGGNNSSWTAAPLMTMGTVVDHVFDGLWFVHSYSSAVSVRGAWDTRWNNISSDNCGATDGVHPAFLFYSNSGDGGNSTNNHYFSQLRIEGYRTGALWCVGASNNDQLSDIKLQQGKFEISAADGVYGPAIKLSNVADYTQDEIQMVARNPAGSGQSTPIGGLLFDIANCNKVSLGRMTCALGNLTSGSIASMFKLHGSLFGFDYEDIQAQFSDANVPSAVFDWGVGNSFYSVKRGRYIVVLGTGPTTIDTGTPFWGTPVNYDSFSQSSTTGTTTGFTAGSGTAMNSASTSTGGTGSSAYTYGDIVLALKNAGLLAP